MNRDRATILLAVAALVTLLAGCGPAAMSSPTPTPEPATPTAQSPSPPAESLTQVTLAMGFVPNVQFAPFYVAVEKGYFAERGIEVKFDYGMEQDLVKLVGTGELRFTIASGDQILLARSQGLPVRYVMTWYRRWPVAVAALEDLKGPKDLEGKKVGIPGLFGASYVGWQALLFATGVDPDQVELTSIGFTQVPAVTEGKVDAVVVYAANEPVQLRQQGYQPQVIYVADHIELVSNGIITNEETIAQEPELVRDVVHATLEGLQDTIEDPEGAFALTLEHVPEAGGENREAQMAVLRESVKFWRAERLGYSEAETWQTTQDFMLEAGLIDQEMDVNEMYTNRFID